MYDTQKLNFDNSVGDKEWFVSASSMSQTALTDPVRGIVMYLPVEYSPRDDQPDSDHPFPYMREQFIKSLRKITVPIDRLGFDNPERIRIVHFSPFDFTHQDTSKGGVQRMQL